MSTTNTLETIETNCFGITVILTEDDDGGEVTSDLKNEDPKTENDRLYNAAVGALESMVLGHAYAGVDIRDPKYLQGIEEAQETVARQYG